MSPQEAAFRCPVCNATTYVPVRVQRPSGNWYKTPFYECFKCSVMFVDPQKFAGNVVAGDGIDRSPRMFEGKRAGK